MFTHIDRPILACYIGYHQYTAMFTESMPGGEADGLPKRAKGGMMIAKQLSELDLMEAWQEESAMHCRVTFPLLGVPGTESLGSVYFEIDPGDELAAHTDSQDEIVVLLSGSGEGRIGDETAEVSAGGMVFIPAMAPHGFRNTGSETIRALGIFAGSNVVSTFEHELQPMGTRVVDQSQLLAGVD